MARHRLLLSLLASAMFIAGVAGCGVKVNDDAGGPSPTIDIPKVDGPTTTDATGSGTGGSTGTLPKRPDRTTTTRAGRTTTTDFSSDPSTGGFDFRSSLIDTYQKLGLTKEQATCLTDGIVKSGAVDPSNPAAAPDLDFSALSDVLVQCNISVNDFGTGSGFGD